MAALILAALCAIGPLVVAVGGPELFKQNTLGLFLMVLGCGVPLGLAMGRFRPFEKVLDPVVELFRPISPLAWIPMAIIWFGIGESGKLFIIFIATFFPTLLNTIAAWGRRMQAGP